MRVFLFGAITVKKMGMSYDPETAFYGSSLHDIGLLPAFASPNGSFEVDGADTAKKFLRDNGVAAPSADTVWHAIVLHDWRRKVTVRQGGDALVVAAGAGCDVGGPGSEVDAKQVEEILQAFPRLQFKVRFTDLLKDHCRRKPLSQSRSWLEGLCREQVPSAFTDTVEKDIAAAPFTE